MGCCGSKKGSADITAVRAGPLARSGVRGSYYDKHRGLRARGGAEDKEPPPQPKPGREYICGFIHNNMIHLYIYTINKKKEEDM